MQTTPMSALDSHCAQKGTAMANSSDTPPLPHIPALDPAAFEQSWSDAPRLLAALNGAHLGAWFWDVDSGQVEL